MTDRVMIAQIDLGHAIESFMSGSIGKYLLNRAAGEAIDAIDALKHVDPLNADEIRRLQNIIHRAEGFEIWLEEGFQQGKVMEQQLELSEAPD
jgi:hypothetical protein